ncbi:lipocalin family protein [Rhodonellum sp.]|uniref:lipocalin family protein n=1 Tax=Rhodonellum sp. TaxID=2231180 RepID=UPI00272681C5|nr:lipocalin family protein [Rhodonellum sp.]MDO9552697.1 lipocalin family protein [Rhodonellum sp.]
MKKILTLPLFIILLFASSCQDGDDTLPLPFLGTWEMVGFNNYLELDYVTIYVFKGDGTYSYSSTLREQGSVVDLGYNFHESGTFLLDNNTIVFTRTAFLHRPYFGEKVHYAKEELQSTFVEGYPDYSKTYSLRNEGNELFFPGGIVGGDVIEQDMKFEKVN